MPDERTSLNNSDKQAYLVRLHELLSVRFDLEELRILCFQLDVDYEDLGGRGKSGKIREMITYLARRERLADIIKIGRNMRPDISWDNFVFASDEVSAESVDLTTSSGDIYTQVSGNVGNIINIQNADSVNIG